MILSRQTIIEALQDGSIKHSECPLPISSQIGQKRIVVDTKKGSATVDMTEEQEFAEWCKRFVGPMSIDLMLADDFLMENPSSGQKMDDSTHRYFVKTKANESDLKSQFQKLSHTRRGDGRVDPIAIGPGLFVIAQSTASIHLSPALCAQVMPRLTTDLWGLSFSPSFVGPGHKGPIHFAIYNHTRRLFTIQPDTRYAQLIFHRLEDKAEYNGHYNLKESGKTGHETLLPQSLTD